MTATPCNLKKLGLYGQQRPCEMLQRQERSHIALWLACDRSHKVNVTFHERFLKKCFSVLSLFYVFTLLFLQKEVQPSERSPEGHFPQHSESKV